MCTKCNIEKPLDAFSRCSRVKRDGRVARCKACAAAYYQATKERAAERQREWVAANAEKVREGRRRYYRANRERLLARNREWREAHPTRVRELNQRYYEKNRKEHAAASTSS